MRISIVDHQHFHTLRSLIETVPGYQIAWSAANGHEACKLCLIDPPDLLLMALQMPDMDGVEATRQIMKHSPCPILLMASSVESHAGKIFAAMGEGAKDVLNYPHPEEAEKGKQALLRKLRTMATLQTPEPGMSSKHPHLPPFNMASEKLARTAKLPQMANLPKLIAIGASTGGPNALAQVLKQLPADLNAAIVIVQHLTEEFSFDLTAWLDAQSALNVHLAVENSRPRNHHVYIAHSNDHLILGKNCCFAYTPEPRHIHYRPSVDVFFESLAHGWPGIGIGVLLTGMGRDGAEGLAALKRKGWHTIAQDQHSSVVYGMPKAAKELNAALDILPLDQIGQAILQQCDAPIMK